MNIAGIEFIGGRSTVGTHTHIKIFHIYMRGVILNGSKICVRSKLLNTLPDSNGGDL